MRADPSSKNAIPDSRPRPNGSSELRVMPEMRWLAMRRGGGRGAWPPGRRIVGALADRCVPIWDRAASKRASGALAAQWRRRADAARRRRSTALSVHADRGELVGWLRKAKAEPDSIFVVHGEPKPAAALREQIESELGWNAIVPGHLERVQVSRAWRALY